VFWSETIWERSRRESFDLQHPASLRTEHDAEAVLAVQRQNQEAWRAAGFNVDMHGMIERLRSARALYDPMREREALAEGWDSATSVEAWRDETLELYANVLKTPGREPYKTYVDWMAPFVDLAQIATERTDFGHMLLYEVDIAAMPRNWLRWAVRFAQTAAKLERGNPRDEQLAAYLPDADLFISNDRRFCRVLDAVVAAAPTSLADVRFAGITNDTAQLTPTLEAIIGSWSADHPASATE
jgi:hypothetical protein